MHHKIFSIDEANALIPTLETALERLGRLTREVAALRREIEVLAAIQASGAEESSPDVRALREAEARHGELQDRFRGELSAFAEHGCVLRDLELGLVDFYTMARNQVVCLCWRRGEPRVEHWHPVNEGFSGRRPLADLV